MCNLKRVMLANICESFIHVYVLLVLLYYRYDKEYEYSHNSRGLCVLHLLD